MGQATKVKLQYHDCTELKKNPILCFMPCITLKLLILPFVRPIVLCCPVLCQVRPIDAPHRISNIKFHLLMTIMLTYAYLNVTIILKIMPV